jgi:hypothetical protein
MISDSENKKIPFGKKELNIGIIGMTEGNGHPYSWSAMINGYDDRHMAGNPYPGIYAYLKKQPEQTIGIPGVRVSHIYCDNKADAADVAKCSLIENIAAKPEDMIGQVDAVIVATDIGSEHVERCRPFIEADIPILIDKPLADCQKDLNTFINWHKQGRRFISSSSMRYTKELEPYYKNHYELGDLMYICQPMCKKWETYGIHALEGIYPLLGPGFISIQNTGTYEKNMVHLTHKSGCDVHIPLKKEMYSAFGTTLIIGAESSVCIKAQDSYYPFKKQLDRFVNWLRTGEQPQPFSETVELIKMVIGGIKSREMNGEKIMLDDIKLDT